MAESTKTPRTRTRKVGTPVVSETPAASETKDDGRPEAETVERGAFPATGPVAFYIDGTRRLGFTQHRLSYVAGYTADRANGVPRIPVRDLVAAILATVPAAKTEDDLYRLVWGPFVLPQTGRTIETRAIPGREDGLLPVETPKPKSRPRRARTAKTA
jgi:hypothetical protein